MGRPRINLFATRCQPGTGGPRRACGLIGIDIADGVGGDGFRIAGGYYASGCFHIGMVHAGRQSLHSGDHDQRHQKQQQGIFREALSTLLGP